MAANAGSAGRRRRTWDLTHLATKYPWLRVDSETIEEFRAPFEWVRGDEQRRTDAKAQRQLGSRTSSAGDSDEEEGERGDEVDDDEEVEEEGNAGQRSSHRSPRKTRRGPGPRENGVSRRYSLANSTGPRSPQSRYVRRSQRAVSPIRHRHDHRDTKKRRLPIPGGLEVAAENRAATPSPRPRSETDTSDTVHISSSNADPNATESTVLPTAIASPELQAAVYADFQSLQRREHQRQANSKQLNKANAASTRKKPAHHYLTLTFPAIHKKAPVAKNNLAQQLKELAREGDRLRAEMANQIEEEKAKLPLTFLFERRLDQSYCKAKSITTITTIFSKLQHRLLYSAFQRWLELVEAQRQEERRAAAIKRAQERALAFFERLASDAYVGTLDRAFRRWAETARAMATREREDAAVLIQAIYRRRRARSLLADLKQAAADREYKRDQEIQQLLRFELYGTAMKWSTLRLGFNLLVQNHCARCLQFFFRRLVLKRRVARRLARKQAATRIQTQWRGRLARDERRRLVRARAIRLERERVASVHIQRRTRGYLARQHAAVLRQQQSRENQGALRLQRWWRRAQGLRRLQALFSHRRRLLDAERARQEELARLERLRQEEARRQALATDIQRVGRGFLGRREASRRRRARDLDLAVRRVQFSWRRSRGRYALHLRFLAQRERLDERREQAAVRIQCHLRQFLARQERGRRAAVAQRRRASAITIQRIVRGRQAQRTYDRQRRATVVMQKTIRGRLARDERRRRVADRQRLARLRDEATVRLQCWARRLQARWRVLRLRAERAKAEELLRQSAVLIQKRARGMEARRVAELLRQAMAVVEALQRRRYAYSTQHNVNTTPLLTFMASQYLTLTAAATAVGSNDPDVDGAAATSLRAQLAWLEGQLAAARAEMAREDRAVVLLQRHYRGFATRLGFHVLQVQRRQRLVLEERMARRLQRVGRGFLARRRVRRLRQRRQAEALKAAYIRERRAKELERAFEERYQQEQMTLQLQRLQALEAQVRDAKREAEVAKWNAEAAAYRRQELEAEAASRRLEKLITTSPAAGASSATAASTGDGARRAKWEQVYDAYGNAYYYNASTGESAWERPPPDPEPVVAAVTAAPPVSSSPASSPTKVNERASVDTANQHKKTTDKAVAGAEVEAEAEAKNAAVPPGFCHKCRVVEAIKECLDCGGGGGGGGLDPNHRVAYCAPCFALEHGVMDPTGVAAGKPRHDFRLLRETTTRPSRCQNPQCPSVASASTVAIGVVGSPPPPRALATFYCGECPMPVRFYCETCFPIVHETAQLGPHVPLALHFRTGAGLCCECHERLAQRHCEQCDEGLCPVCFEVLHPVTSAHRAQHTFRPLEILKDELVGERDAYCTECDRRRCTRLCNLCGDGMCDECFAQTHNRGQKALHTWIPWADFTAHGDWLEILDEQSGQLVYFNIETKESTHTQPFVLKRGEERHRLLFQEREQAMKRAALELESEIVKLRERLQTLEAANEAERPLSRSLRGTARPETATATTTATAKPSKPPGILGGLFRRKPKPTTTPGAKPLSPEELQRRALIDGVTASERALLQAKLKTREREAAEAQARRTVGTKLFEDSMVQQLSQAP